MVSKLTARQKAACDAVARIRRPLDGCDCMTATIHDPGRCGCEEMALAALAAADGVETQP